MKILHTADWHIGRTLDGNDLHGEQGVVLEQIVEIANEKKPDVIVIAGDLFDLPSPSADSQHLCHKYIIELGKITPVLIIPGNHDVFHKNTNDLCSLKELLGYYTSNINIVMKPSTLNYDGCDVHLVPWINSENWDSSMNFLSSNKGIMMGHLELQGFEMMRGVTNTHGMSKKTFKRFECVMSGHFHTKSAQDNIHYLGSQFEFTWADASDPKYFQLYLLTVSAWLHLFTVYE